MRGIIRRLLLLVHWLGFMCVAYWVVTFLTMALPALTEGLNGLESAFEDIISILAIMLDLDEAEYPVFWSLWFAAAHYPALWLLTGNNAILPWKNK